MEEEEARSPWLCSTNWNETEEFPLRSSISFETSDEDAPALTSAGSVLTRPVTEDPPPCEVTLLLNGKYEIHRIYVKTTARTFEVYYSKANSNAQSDTKEYLCTVKCGPALSGSNSNSAHSSEEETWVEVKSSSSTTGENQMHYEATAEISDVDPCISLTLRFLSLQNKSSIHIEEIYILADPVEGSSTTENSNTGTGTSGNFNANSMFAMLVPNLLQMSKSGLSNRINDQYFSTDRIQNIEKVQDQSANFQNPEKVNRQNLNPINSENLRDQTVNFQIPITEKVNIQEPVDQKTHINNETLNSINTNQVEKLLETLVSKVDNIENYFTKFEEKIVVPINNIQSRLLNLESRFDQFSTDLQILKNNSVADGVAGHSRPGSEIEKLVVRLESRFDRFSEEIESMKVRKEGNNSVDDCAAGQFRPGFRAPDFISDDDSTDDDDILNDNNNDNNNNINNDNNENNVSNNNDNNGSKRRPISIDGALASALAAFASGSKSDPTAEIDSKMNDEIPDKSLNSESGVPLVFMDEVRIEGVSVSDPFLSFEEINDEKGNECENEINELERILDQIDELEQNSDQIDELEKKIDELNLGEMNESEQVVKGSDDERKKEEGFFCKSVIGEISDEEEEEENLGFESDLHRFTCNSPLSESASEFESNFPTFNISNNNNDDDNNSTDSSFDENFLKTRVQIDLSDNESIGSGDFEKSILKSSEIARDLIGGNSGNVLSSNGPLIDLDLEEDLGNLSETCQKNVEQFESLI